MSTETKAHVPVTGWTKGPCVPELDDGIVVRAADGGQIAMCGNLCGPFGMLGRRDTREVEANARLIAEAFNVATETGLTPRQLAEQRAQLIEALKMTQFGFNHRRCPACAGWNVGPNGETDDVHTASCPVGAILAKCQPAEDSAALTKEAPQV